MMPPQISATMHSVLTTTTEAAATTLRYAKRPDRAKFTPGTLVQTLVFGWLAEPQATVAQLAQIAERLGVEGTVNLSSNSTRITIPKALRSRIRPRDGGLCSYLEAGYFVPDPESTLTLPAVVLSP